MSVRARWLGVLAAIEFVVIVVLATMFALERRSSKGDEGEAPVVSLQGDRAPQEPARRLDSRRTAARSPVPDDVAGGPARSDSPASLATGADVSLGAFVVHGAVTDAEGIAVPGSFGQFIAEEGEGAPIPFFVRDGVYSAAGLAPGRYSLRCQAPGFRERVEIVDLDPPAAFRRIDIVLERSVSIAVRFLAPDGRALTAALEDARFGGGLRAIATREAPARFTRAADLDSVGGFHSAEATDGTPAPDGVLRLHESPPVYASAVWAEIVMATEFVPVGVSEVTFVMPIDAFESTRASVRLRVVDATSRSPIAGVLVRGEGDPLVTGADGLAAFEGLRPGRVTIGLFGPGSFQLMEGGASISRQGPAGTYKDRSVSVTLEPGAAVDLGDVPMHVACAFSGVALDAEGRPVEAGFRLVPRERHAPNGDHLDSSLRREGEVFRSRKDDGAFEAIVAPGAYVLVSEARDRARFAISVDVPSDGLSDFALTSVPGVEVRLRPSPALLARFPRVVVEDRAGVAVLSDELATVFRRSTLRLPPGPHTVRILLGDAVLATESFTVGDEPMEIPIR